MGVSVGVAMGVSVGVAIGMSVGVVATVTRVRLESDIDYYVY